LSILVCSLTINPGACIIKRSTEGREEMKAVVLVGGEGTRLRPLTCNTSKAMVPILNMPFLEYLLRYLKNHGIGDIILATSYLPERIQGSFGDGAKLGLHLTYLIEKEPLDTAGAVKNAESSLDEPFFVINGDVLTAIDLTAMMKRHREVKPRVSIALTAVDNPTIYGVVETDAKGMVKRFVEKPPLEEVTTNMINAGIYIVEPEVLANIPPSTRSSFERTHFPQLLKAGEPILGYASDQYWIDIGTPEKYIRVQHDLLSGRAPSLSRYWGKLDGGIQMGSNSTIDPSAEIEGAVLIGEKCVIAKGARIKGPAVLGARCRVDQEALVEGAILWDNARVGKKAMLSNCVIASNSYVQEESQVLENCVLGDNVVVGRNNRLAPGTRVWPDKRIAAATLSF
jgi:mannose-1-phosphate guanylyltransferase